MFSSNLPADSTGASRDLRVPNRAVGLRLEQAVLPVFRTASLLSVAVLGMFRPDVSFGADSPGVPPLPPPIQSSVLRSPVDILTQVGTNYGAQVFTIGTGGSTNAVHVWKFYHGGISAIPFFKRHPEQFTAFLRHQNSLMELHTQLLRVVGPEKFRLVLESYQGDMHREDVSPAKYQEMRDLELRMAKLRTDLKGESGIERQLFEQFMAEPDARKATTFLNSLSFPLRFTCFCLDQGHEQVLLASEPLNHPSLAANFHREIDRLAMKEKLSDAELQTAIDGFRVAESRDFRLRHEFVRDAVAEAQRSGHVVSVVLGGSHLRAGAQFSGIKPTAFPLENALMEKGSGALVVWDERNLPALLNVDLATMGARALAIDDITPAILRGMVEARRR